MKLANEGRILICDFLPTSELGGSLRVILETPSQSGIELQHRVAEVRRSAFGPADLSRIVAHFKPNLVFFVLSPALFARAKSLLETLRMENLVMPALVVMDGGEPNEMLELLEFGATDFITAPLKSVEILPRVWRMRGFIQMESRM